jgi:hypothetical protein
MKRGGRTLALDRLPDPADAAKVLWLRGLDVGGEAGRVREPHRHDYHELVWIHSGRGEHLLDGQPVPVRPGTVTLIGRGQVHVFVCARAVEGAVVRFGDELLFGSAAMSSQPVMLTHLVAVSTLVEPPSSPLLVPVTSSTKLS